GDATKLKENPGYRLRIAPLPANTGFGSICGTFTFFQAPAPVAPPPSAPPTDEGGGGGPQPRTPEATPAQTRCPGRSCDNDDDGRAADEGGIASMGIVSPLLGVTTVLSVLPLVARAFLRRRRSDDGAWDNRARVHRRPDADPGGG
ncbi:MAG TPA: hypothetical protein VHK63_09255, partial [Candidatus Limnocylindria bacterium]|nr:hypothetical protein [Candidatus Limnocylindria bacterium]